MGQFLSLGGLFSTPAAVVQWGASEEHLLAFGVGTDHALWFAQLDGFTADDSGGVWSQWQSLGGVVTSAPCAVRSGESSVDVFASGAHGELLHWEFHNGVWNRWRLDPPTNEPAFAARVTGPAGDIGLHRNWESLGGIIITEPSATMFGELNDTTLVFGVGTDHALWVRGRENGVWRAWDSLGHTLASAPHAVTFQRETFAVFALGTDSAIWYTMGSTWHSLGGTFATAPCAISSDRHIQVFAVDSHHTLQRCQWDGQHWTHWESLGGIVMSAPTANCFPNTDLVHVFGIGTDSAVWRRRWVGDSWSDWHSLGGPFLSAPATVTRRPPDSIFETRDLVALRTDHALWHLEEED